MADPLTTIYGMITRIEPGPRLIDGYLLRELYILAGDGATAATIERGWRMVDAELLRRLALRITAVQTAQQFPIPGPRLNDGTPWKALSMMVHGDISPLSTEVRHGEAWYASTETYAQQSVRSTGQGGGAAGQGSGELPDPRQEPREERLVPRRPARHHHREGHRESRSEA